MAPDARRTGRASAEERLKMTVAKKGKKNAESCMLALRSWRIKCVRIMRDYE